MPEPSYWALVCRSSQTPNHWIASLLRLEIFARCGMVRHCCVILRKRHSKRVSRLGVIYASATRRSEPWTNRYSAGVEHGRIMSPIRLFLCSSARSSVFACFTHRQQWPMHYPIRLFMSFVIPTIRYQPRDTPVTSLRNVSIIFELHRMNLELMDARRSLFARPK